MHLSYSSGMQIAFVLCTIHTVPLSVPSSWNCCEQREAGVVLPEYPCHGPWVAKVWRARLDFLSGKQFDSEFLHHLQRSLCLME